MELTAPRENADNSAYWAGARSDTFLLRCCGDCGAAHFPPRVLCPTCWSEHLSWIAASGQGVVYSYTILHRAPLPEFAQRVPYVVALIDLPEGVRVMANIVGPAAAAVAIGERVEVCFETRGSGKLPQFQRTLASIQAP